MGRFYDPCGADLSCTGCPDGCSECRPLDADDVTAEVVVHTVTLGCGCKVPTVDAYEGVPHVCPKAVA